MARGALWVFASISYVTLLVLLTSPHSGGGVGGGPCLLAQAQTVKLDLYRDLGVPRSASKKDIKKAFRKLSREFHPDVNPKGKEKYEAILRAYGVLHDDAKRKTYDESGIVNGVNDQGRGPNGGGGAGGGFDFSFTPGEAFNFFFTGRGPPGFNPFEGHPGFQGGGGGHQGPRPFDTSVSLVTDAIWESILEYQGPRTKIVITMNGFFRECHAFEATMNEMRSSLNFFADIYYVDVIKQQRLAQSMGVLYSKHPSLIVKIGDERPPRSVASSQGPAKTADDTRNPFFSDPSLAASLHMDASELGLDVARLMSSYDTVAERISEIQTTLLVFYDDLLASLTTDAEDVPKVDDLVVETSDDDDDEDDKVEAAKRETDTAEGFGDKPRRRRRGAAKRQLAVSPASAGSLLDSTASGLQSSTCHSCTHYAETIDDVKMISALSWAQRPVLIVSTNATSDVDQLLFRTHLAVDGLHLVVSAPPVVVKQLATDFCDGLRRDASDIGAIVMDGMENLCSLRLSYFQIKSQPDLPILWLRQARRSLPVLDRLVLDPNHPINKASSSPSKASHKAKKDLTVVADLCQSKRHRFCCVIASYDAAVRATKATLFREAVASMRTSLSQVDCEVAFIDAVLEAEWSRIHLGPMPQDVVEYFRYHDHVKAFVGLRLAIVDLAAARRTFVIDEARPPLVVGAGMSTGAPTPMVDYMIRRGMAYVRRADDDEDLGGGSGGRQRGGRGSAPIPAYVRNVHKDGPHPQAVEDLRDGLRRGSALHGGGLRLRSWRRWSMYWHALYERIPLKSLIGLLVVYWIFWGRKQPTSSPAGSNARRPPAGAAAAAAQGVHPGATIQPLANWELRDAVISGQSVVYLIVAQEFLDAQSAAARATLMKLSLDFRCRVRRVPSAPSSTATAPALALRQSFATLMKSLMAASTADIQPIVLDDAAAARQCIVAIWPKRRRGRCCNVSVRQLDLFCDAVLDGNCATVPIGSSPVDVLKM